MIFTKQPLHVLTITYGVVAGVLAFLGAQVFIRRGRETGEGAGTCAAEGQKRLEFPGACGGRNSDSVQLIVVVLYAHMDERWCFYVGQATTAVETDSLYAYNPYTGAAYNVLPSRYILSPFPAFLCRDQPVMRRTSSSHWQHTVFQRYLFSSICGAFQYSHQILQRKSWRTGDFYDPLCRDPVDCGYSVYNSEIFAMGRIWRGKAVLAGVFYHFYFCSVWRFYAGKTGISMEPGFSGKWSLLSVFLNRNHACPLLMGVFALFSLVKFRNRKKILKECSLLSAILDTWRGIHSGILGGGEMKRALLASLDAWQKYWGNRFYVYLLLAAFLYFLVFGRKKNRPNFILLYCSFLAVFFCP